jgi:ribbon-helix-helix protein
MANGYAQKRSNHYTVDSRMAAHHTCCMKRTTIWLSDQQVKELAKLSKKTGIKQAELIRRFIDAGIVKSDAIR